MIVAAFAIGLASDSPVHAGQRDDGNQKPSLAFKATPPVGFGPLKVRFTIDVRGGADDYADFYCASVEWDWADGTTSGSSEDCEPYEAGKSTIRRRFTADRTFREAGVFEVTFRLKQKSRVVASSKGTVRVLSGVNPDDF